MKPKLFHTLVLVGAAMTGTVGLAVVPAAIVTLSGCGGHPVYGTIDDGSVQPDLTGVVYGAIDASPHPVYPDLSITDGSVDAGT